MYSSDEALFPLAGITQQDLASLCQALWRWRPCEEWVSGQACRSTGACPCRQAAKLGPFFDYYKETTAYYLPDEIGNANTALRSHDDVCQIITLLKANTDKTRSQVTTEYFTARSRNQDETPNSSDQDRAFNIAARIMGMVQPAADDQPDGLLEAGTQPTTWHSNQSFKGFMGCVFPKTEHPALDLSDNNSPAKVFLAAITAKRLKKVARLTIVPTNDLRDHLLLNDKQGTVSVFHYTSVLKQHLDTHILPPQLALETLATLKEVLFPDDSASQSVLRALVNKGDFDPDIMKVVDSPLYLSAVRNPLAYHYWGARLLDLHDELDNPTPRGLLERWLERKSGARYMMLATLAGVALAIILGFLSLALGIFQAWIGWQQWQHPVN